MTAYALAQFTIHDRARYAKYVSQFGQVLARFRGRLLVADEAPDVIEGSWPTQKVVLLAFETEEALWAFARSHEYQTISEDRVAATHGSVLLLHGVT